MAKENFVHSLKKGLKILETFTPENPKLKLQELTLSTGLPKTTVFRFLHTLTALNYVRFDNKTREYFLGPKVMSLGYATLAGIDLREIARPYLEELSQSSGQNVNIGILDGTEVVYIERIIKRHLIRTDRTVGSRVNIYETAIGRAILANLDGDKFEKIWRELLSDPVARKHIGKNSERFLNLLEGVRRNGYSVSDEDFIPGIRAIAAPIFSAKGNAEAAINMPVFTKTVSQRQLTKRYAPMLVDTATRISAFVAS